MSRDTKGKFSKNKTDGEVFSDEETEKKFFDKPPSLKFILLSLLVIWLSTFVLPDLKEETTRRLSTFVCHARTDGEFTGDMNSPLNSSRKNSTHLYTSGNTVSKDK